jgi:hypothetical protein
VEIGESSPRPSSERPPPSDWHVFDLPAGEVDLERREAALARIERAMAMTPVPATYFGAGPNAGEETWWAKQLGSM